jgi:hypothetical protein
MEIPYDKVSHLFGKELEIIHNNDDIVIFTIIEERLKKFNSLIHPYKNKYFYLSHVYVSNRYHVTLYFTAGTILNDTIYIKKNNLNTHYKNLGISANVNLASRNINTSEPSRNGNEFKLSLRFF